MDTDTETVQEEMQEVVAPMDEAMESTSEDVTPVLQEETEERQEERVPLSALQKERKKRKDAEQRADERSRLLEGIYAKQLSETAAPEDDSDQYESLTKAEYNTGKQEITRSVMEAIWAKENPDKVEDVNENLKQFLNQRPHLKLAIEAAPNRYEEAYTLMNALSPKQKQAMKAPPVAKKATPGSPSAVPKAAGVNQTIDIMSMTDTEYFKWRSAQRKGR